MSNDIFRFTSATLEVSLPYHYPTPAVILTFFDGA